MGHGNGNEASKNGDPGLDHCQYGEAVAKPPVVSSAKKPPYHLASRVGRVNETVVRVGDVNFGSDDFIVIAGPCAVESEEQLIIAALGVKHSGAKVLRGGAFKPRTSPYDFRGLGEEGLKILAKARDITGLPIITEVLSENDVDLVAQYADILQIGSRNMNAFTLLEAAARTGKPVMLKRGFASTIKEWLLSAEYILAQGNDQVILCERGIRSFDSDFVRNTLDLNAVVVLKEETHLPVIVDPSHGTGKVSMVSPMAKAAIAAGADGIMVEVHPTPAEALCDGKQSLDLLEFDIMMSNIKPFVHAMGKGLSALQVAH